MRQLCLLICVIIMGAQLGAAELPTRGEVKELANRAQNWLLTQQQDDGSFFPGDQFRLGITTLATLSLLQNGMDPANPVIANACTYMKGFVQPDGGIYNPQEGLGNYCTSLGLRALLKAGQADDELVAGAQRYLFGLQNTEEGAVTEGGIGYGSRGDGNEDLSNTTMAIAALAESGIPADDPRMQRALHFITRCQNLSSHNKLDWADNDGGAVYSPDSSKASGSYHDGSTGDKPASGSGGATKLTSYGSMTYALISSYIYLDLDKNDPRVQAALKWVSDNYQFDANPGMAAKQSREGLFYYYEAMAKTFDLLDQNTIGEHDWRGDLFAAIKQRAQLSPDNVDGGPQAFWINDQPRWGEGIPHLTTAYMLSALARIHDSLPE